jgi:hypothetical protein
MRKGDLDHAVGKAVVDGLKWLAGKDSPRYADKMTIDQTIRPGAPEPESEDVTKAWIARAIAGVPVGGNVIKLVPQRLPDEDTDEVRNA